MPIVRSLLAVLAIAYGLWLLPASPAETASRGFDLCVPPVEPHCMADDATFASAGAKAQCDSRAMHFVGALAVYRTCLLRSSEGAITRGNEALFAYRCRSGQTDRCGLSGAAGPSAATRAR